MNRIVVVVAGVVVLGAAAGLLSLGMSSTPPAQQMVHKNIALSQPAPAPALVVPIPGVTSPVSVPMPPAPGSAPATSLPASAAPQPPAH